MHCVQVNCDIIITITYDTPNHTSTAVDCDSVNVFVLEVPRSIDSNTNAEANASVHIHIFWELKNVKDCIYESMGGA